MNKELDYIKKTSEEIKAMIHDDIFMLIFNDNIIEDDNEFLKLMQFEKEFMVCEMPRIIEVWSIEKQVVSITFESKIEAPDKVHVKIR